MTEITGTFGAKTEVDRNFSIGEAMFTPSILPLGGNESVCHGWAVD